MDLMFEWVEKKESRGRKANEKSFVSFSVNKNGFNKDGEQRFAFAITLFKKAIEELRLIKGDRIEIGFDKTVGLIAIKRTTNKNGYMLSNSGSSSKSLKVQIPYNRYPFLKHDSIYLDKNNYFEQDGMFIFNINTFGLKIK